MRRLAGISASLVGTNAATSVLGLVFWTVAARTLDASAVGVAAAAVALMMLVGSLGSLGLGTLLISRLPAESPWTRRRLVRSCLALSGGVAGILSLVSVWPAIGLFGMDNLRPVISSPADALLFAVATALTAVTMVLDQAVLVLGIGSLQLERNVVASLVKILVLLALVSTGLQDGLAVVMAWTVGNLVSLPLVAHRTRGGRRLEGPGPLIDLRVLRGLGCQAVGHHALNLGLQLPLQLLPVVVTVMLSARENGYFSTALLVTGFVFTLPYAVSVGLFAAADGDEHEVLRRLRWTVPFGIVVSLTAVVVLYPLAGFVLGTFGHGYEAEATGILRVLVLAGMALVVKDHFVALRRVQHRTGEAAAIIAGFSVMELVLAAAGAHWGGALGLSWAWVVAVAVEAVVLAFPLVSGVRARQGLVPAAAPSTLPFGISLSVLGDLPQDRVQGRRQDTPPGSLDSLLDVRRRESPAPPRSSVAGLPVPPRPSVAGLPVPPRPSAVKLSAVKLPAAPPVPRHAVRPEVRRPERDLLGVTLVVMSAGLAVTALASAYARVRAPGPWVDMLYAVGLATMFLPAAARIVYAATGRRERILLGLALPVLLQLVRFVLHPTSFAYHDELIHQNTLRLIAETHRLFTVNPLLPVSSYYPALEIATDAVRSLTGLGPFASANIVLILARLVMAAAFMALIASLTGSLRAAAIASVLYTCNPQLIFFNSQFSYQTLALPLAVLTAYVLRSRDRRGMLPLLGGIAALVAVVASHHLTSILLVGGLALWTLLELTLGRRRHARSDAPALAAVTGVGLMGAAVATLNPGNPIAGYLVDIVESSTNALNGFWSGHSTKTTFTDPAGATSQAWEHLLMVCAVVVVAFALPPALVRARIWWRRRVPLAIGLVLLAALFPVIPAGHLTRATAEVGDRTAGFVFLGVAFVLAWAARDLPITWRWSVAGAAVATSVFVGNVILGAGPIGAQLPGPYKVAADARSIDAHNLAAARWIAAELPPGSRVYANRVSGLLAAAVGGQFTVRHVSTKLDASRLILDPQFTPEDVAVARAARIAYVIVDERDATSLPHEGIYIENGEFGAQGRTQPVPRAALTKLATVPGVQRVYDNGSIVIHDIRGMRRAG